MKIENHVNLEFPSRSANEGFARAAAACFAAQLDPTLEEVNDVTTAVSEAVTHAIVHAYPDTIGNIAMKLRLREDHSLEIVIRDWGVGMWTRPGHHCLPQGTRSGPEWASPLWRALWTR